MGFLAQALLPRILLRAEVVFLPLLCSTVSASGTPPELNPDLQATFAKVKWKLGRWSGGSRLFRGLSYVNS